MVPDRKTIVTDCRFPDGIGVDVQAGHIYWTNMGIPNLDDGSIEFSAACTSRSVPCAGRKR
jgi:hypothetical protein